MGIERSNYTRGSSALGGAREKKAKRGGVSRKTRGGWAGDRKKNGVEQKSAWKGKGVTAKQAWGLGWFFMKTGKEEMCPRGSMKTTKRMAI